MENKPTPQAIEEAFRIINELLEGPYNREACEAYEMIAAALRAAREEIEQLRSRVQTCVECGGTLIWGPVVDQFARAEKAEAELAAVKVERDGYLTDCRTWAKEVDKLRESLARAEKALESIVVMASLGQQDSFKAEVTKQAREALKSGTNS